MNGQRRIRGKRESEMARMKHGATKALWRRGVVRLLPMDGNEMMDIDSSGYVLI